MRPHCERQRPAAVAKTTGLVSLCYAFSFTVSVEVCGPISAVRAAAVGWGALLLAALAGAQTETKNPAVPPQKKAAPAPAKKAAAPSPSTSEEEQIPAAPDALFPAVVARVNGRE